MWYDLTIESSRHPEEYKRKSEKLGYDDEHFNWLRAVGVRPKDIYDAASKGFDVSDYGNARKNGLSHEDYITKNAHKWYHEASNDDENFGLNEREQAKIKGKAIADHLWEGLENIFAPMGFGLQKKLETLKELEERFPNHTIKIEEDDDPYVSHKVGDWEGRYYGGPYIELHHKKYGPMEVINLHNYETNESHKLTQNELHNEVEHFVKHDAQQYVDDEEYNNRTSSKWYLASEKVMPSSENSPWEIYPRDPQDIGSSTINVDKSPCRCPDDRCALTGDDPRHGTLSGYIYHKCKCRDCRDFSALENRKRNGLDLNKPIVPIVDQQNVLDMIPEENLFNDPNDPRHGTIRGYNIGCRCDPCRNSAMEYQKQYKLDKLEEMQNDPDHKNHGTPNGYKVGCRCNDCTDAGSEYQKQYNLDKLEEMQNDPDHKNHGTREGYKVGCRCDPCLDARSEHDKQYNLNKLEEMQNNPDHKNHGTPRGYKVGCRCDDCSDAYSEYEKQYRKNKKQSSMWYHESSGETCLNCGVPITNHMDRYCGTCDNIMAQSEAQAYMQVNRNHPEARPGQRARDFSGNE